MKETQVVKGIAILLMLFHHLFNDLEEYAGYTVSYAPFSEAHLTSLAILAKVCVAMFVFITGYGICASYCKAFPDREPTGREMTAFVWNRYIKLMAAYWAIFILTLICQPLGRTIFDAYGRSPRDIIAGLFLDAFGLAFFVQAPTLNPAWWYMSLAIALVILLPFAVRLMKKTRGLLVMGVVMVFLMACRLSYDMTYYFFSALLGAVCFEENVFERLDAWMAGRKVLTVCLTAALFALVFYLRIGWNDYGILEGLIAFSVILLVHEVIARIPGVDRVLGLLGRHSGNMYLFHNQLYAYYFLGFFYSFRHWALVVAALAAVSLIVSIAVEWIKEKTGYNRAVTRLFLK